MARAGRRNPRHAHFALKSVPAVVALLCAGMQTPAQALELARFDALSDWDMAMNWHAPGAQWRAADRAIIEARNAQLSFAAAIAALNPSLGRLGAQRLRASRWGYGAKPVPSDDAMTLTWFGGTGDWSVGANWSPAGGPPGADDTATINAGNAQLGVDTAIGGLVMGGGQLSGSGKLTVSGASQWTGGAHNGVGTSQFDGSLAISGANDKNLGGGRVLNVGDTTWSGNTATNNNRIRFTGATLNSNGTWTDSNAFDAYTYSYSGTNAFNNIGAYNKQGNTLTTMDVVYNNLGTTNINAGRLRTTGGGTSASAFNVASGAVLDFNYGTYNLNAASITGSGTTEISGSSGYSFVNLNGGTISTAMLLSGGNLQGADHTLLGPVTWTGTVIRGAASTTVAGDLAISGANDKNLGGGRVLNVGDTTWSGNTATNNNRIRFTGATINNSGTWTDTNAFDSFVYSYSGTNAFNNAGTFDKQNATTTTMDVVYNNLGTTNINAGRLRTTGGGTSASAFNVASGAVLDFNYGTYNLNAANITGAGTTEVSGSDGYSFVNLNGGTISTAMLLSGGNLQGADHTLLGPVTWTGTVIRGAASTTVAGDLAISGANDKNLGGGRVLNVGDTTWSGNTATNNNRIRFTGATINNSGTWTDTNAFDSFVYSYSGTNAFNNAGTFDKQNATTTTMDVVYNNLGTTNINAGRLRTTGGGTSASAFNVASGAVLDFNYGTYNLNAASITGSGTTEISGSSGYSFVNLNGGTISTAMLLSGGNLQGADHTLLGPVTWTGTVIRGAASTTVAGDLAISGANDKNLGGGRVLNVGDTTWSGNTATNNNRIRFTGATINNSGTWTDTNAFDSFVYSYSGTNAFNNAGTFDKQNATTTTMDVVYNNTGTTNVEAGTMTVTSAFTNHGLVQTAAGATFLGSNAAFVNAGILAGDGTIATHVNGDIVNQGGAIDPGIDGIGHLSITGALVNAATGKLNFELASLASFDTLAVSDDVSLGGEIGVWNLGYTPALGDSFVVMTFAAQADANPFDSIGVYGFAPGTEFTASYHLHDVTLTVSAVAAVPEPQTVLMMLAGLGVLGFVARRRHA